MERIYHIRAQPLELPAHSHTFQQLHDEKPATRLGHAEVVDRQDVGVHEPCGKLGLRPKTLFSRRGTDESLSQQLDGNWTLQRNVERGVHIAHSSLTDPPIQAIPPPQQAGDWGARQDRRVANTVDRPWLIADATLRTFHELVDFASRRLSGQERTDAVGNGHQ